MTSVNDWNTQIIEEFHANEGRVGGNFEGAPITILHHKGRKSGQEYLAPVMYLPSDDDPDTMYVFASAAGAPEHPAWYVNMTTAGNATVEVGTESYPVTVTDVTGAERDRIYAEQVKRYPGFGEYEVKTAGIRTIPVLALHRAS
ncbi:MAG TPA: nitroreductase family deazaflavin-dependent oxidoreductase [Acidothermaceae bacterium]|jgi:deazaflavin-dependent oxidoreductase (nitroreductase family)